MKGRNYLTCLCALALTMSLPPAGVCGQSYKVLYAFQGGSDGDYPSATLIMDKSGNLYGTTAYGGGHDSGVLFKLAPNGAETVLYAFTGGSDGALPASALMRDHAGNLYGTALYGGNAGCYFKQGCGTAFELAADGSFVLLHGFTGGSDGGNPLSPLLRNPHDVLIGTAEEGGKGKGVVYRLAHNGKETVLHTFTAGTDGETPSGQLVEDKKGDLAGTTEVGGSYGYGTVYRLAADGTETILHAFNGSDGWDPEGLIVDGAGNFYGTTVWGGGISCYQWDEGCGVAFKLAPDGTLTVLHSFDGASDGGVPAGRLVRDSKGNLYGAANIGGNTNDCQVAGGCGVVFKLAPDGTLTVLHTFTGGTDGANPASGLLQGPDGYLYGTAAGGGGTSCNNGGIAGCGVIFRIKE